jgi:hypothetical protein
MKNISILDLNDLDYVSVIDLGNRECRVPETIFHGTVIEFILWIVEEYLGVEGNDHSETFEDFLNCIKDEANDVVVVANHVGTTTQSIPVIP